MTTLSLIRSAWCPQSLAGRKKVESFVDDVWRWARPLPRTRGGSLKSAVDKVTAGERRIKFSRADAAFDGKGGLRYFVGGRPKHERLEV
jgi:hypothetical protein